jgi:hypothetical protein
VNHRRFLVPIALAGAFGTALTPALASASTQSAGSAPATVASNAVNSTSAGHEYSSPAANSVFHRTSATSPNPGLFVDMAGGNTSTYGVQFEMTLGNLQSGTVTVSTGWGDGSSDAQTVTAPVKNGQVVLQFSHTYSTLGIYRVLVLASDGQGDDTMNSVVIETGSEYVPYGPTRILDTRNPGAGGAIAPHGKYALKVVGAGTAGATIPAGVTAVALNITATQGTGNGFLTVYGDDTIGNLPTVLPQTSNLNFAANQTVANLVIVPVGADGTVDIYNGAPKGSVHVVADVAGYFTTSTQSAFLAVGPQRILDTRSGVGATKAPVGAGKTLNVTVAGGADGVPANASAVVVHFTTVDSTRNGLITAFPAGQVVPNVSNLNYAAGSITSNTAVVPVGKNGQISLENTSSGSTDIVGDLAGYFTTTPGTGASSYIPYPAPVRYIDSRPGSTDALNGVGPVVGPLNALTAYPFPMPFTNMTTATVPAVVTNATVTSPTGNGDLSLYPYNPAQPSVPTTSNLNYASGQTIANLAFVAPDATADSSGNHDSAIYLGGKGTAEVIVDEFGEFIE